MPVGGQSIAISLSVCLSARTSQKPHVQISSQFLYMLPVAMTRFSSCWRQNNMLCTSGFVDYVIFSCDGASQWATIKDDVYVSSRSHRGATGSEIAV